MPDTNPTDSDPLGIPLGELFAIIRASDESRTVERVGNAIVVTKAVAKARRSAVTATGGRAARSASASGKPSAQTSMEPMQARFAAREDRPGEGREVAIVTPESSAQVSLRQARRTGRGEARPEATPRVANVRRRRARR
mgnify:CR=1 FL=1